MIFKYYVHFCYELINSPVIPFSLLIEVVKAPVDSRMSNKTSKLKLSLVLTLHALPLQRVCSSLI